MKRLFYLLSGLGLIAIVVTVTGLSQAREDEHPSSPLRGTWSWSQFVPATSGFGTPTPIPSVEVGTFVMDTENNFTGHAVLNTPLSSPLGPTLEFDFDGSCTVRKGDISNGLDCLVDVPAFGLSNIGRFCVPMTKVGECFDEFRCTNTTEPGTVL